MRCAQENPPEQKFCGACGARLTIACPACRTPSPAGQKFCGECGTPLAAQDSPTPESYTPRHLAERILQSRSAFEGERKQVTVLFVDVSGFTSLAARLDPEDVHALMRGAFDLMLAEVHRYEGTVNQFLGDGIMALFGAPVAHEDHAARAVHAALGIRAALERYQDELRATRGMRFEARQGLNTGLVVVGSIGNDLRMDYTAVGDTTNVAARLLGAAGGQRILIGAPTYRLVEHHFELRALDPLALKGKDEPVAAWEVLGARARPAGPAGEGQAPFVGRDGELRILLDAFERVAAGRGQVVSIVGEPGIGKSRILRELRSRLGTRATWVEGRALSFGRTIAFHPLIDLLRSVFRIEEGDPEGTIAEKIERSVRRVGEDLLPTLPYFRYLLGVAPGDARVLALDPQLRHAEVFAAVRGLLLQAAARGPQVVVFEDGHWMDRATETQVTQLAESLAASAVLLILTHRPGYAPPFGERTFHVRLSLTTLLPADAMRMAHALLEREGLPRPLAAQIAEKTEGNPFFLEELVKSLGETGADGAVPGRIQDVIAARLDRLPEVPKRTLLVASVIGRDFTRRLLDRVVEEPQAVEAALAELKALELIYERGTEPEGAYTFKHALIRDVAYNSLLVQRRKDLHGRIALALEAVHGDRAAEQAGLIAYHFGRAEAWEAALRYLREAAERAAAAFAPREALALYDEAEEAMNRLGTAVPVETRMAIHRAKAACWLVVSDFDRARAESAHALALARDAGDRVAESAALVEMATAAFWGHRFDQGLEDARRGIEIAEAGGARSVLASGHLTIAFIQGARGSLDDARTETDRALVTSRAIGDVGNEAHALIWAAELKTWEGMFGDAVPLYEEGVRLARALSALTPLFEGLFMAGVCLGGKGDYDAALAMLEECLALAEKVGNEDFPPRLLNSLGWIHGECGSFDRAVELNRRAAERARKRGDHESIANGELNLADVFLAQGDTRVATELLEGVHRMVKDPATSEWMRWRYSIHLFASLAQLWITRGDPERAARYADQCLELATRTRSRKYLVRGWRARGEIALARRRLDESETALREALETARAIGNPPQLWQTQAALGELLSARRDPDGAHATLRAARATLESMSAGFASEELRASLLAAPPVRRVLERAASD